MANPTYFLSADPPARSAITVPSLQPGKLPNEPESRPTGRENETNPKTLSFPRRRGLRKSQACAPIETNPSPPAPTRHPGNTKRTNTRPTRRHSKRTNRPPKAMKIHFREPHLWDIIILAERIDVYA